MSPRFQFKGSEAKQLLGGRSRLVTSLAHKDTVETKIIKQARPSGKQDREKEKESQQRKCNQGGAGRTVLHSAAPLSMVSPGFPSFLQRPRCLPHSQGLRAPMPRGPAALAAPSQEAEESENKGVLGKARVFIQSNGVDN